LGGDNFGYCEKKIDMNKWTIMNGYGDTAAWYSNIYIYIYIQQDATLHGLLYLEPALHVSGGNFTHRQDRKQLYLQHVVFVTPLLLPAASGR